MKTFAKRALWLTFGVALIPVVAIAGYDLLVFQPCMPEIRKLLANAKPEEKQAPQTILRVLQVDPGVELHWHVSRLLLSTIQPQTGRSNGHGHRFMFGVLVALHLSPAEQATVFLSLSYMGQEVHGFAAAAPRLVGVPLGSVSLEQAARLVAVAWAPSISPERQARRAEVLVRRVQASRAEQ